MGEKFKLKMVFSIKPDDVLPIVWLEEHSIVGPIGMPEVFELILDDIGFLSFVESII